MRGGPSDQRTASPPRGRRLDPFTCEIRVVRTSDAEVVLETRPTIVSAERELLDPPTSWQVWEGRVRTNANGVDGEREVEVYIDFAYRVGLAEDLSDARFYWAPWIVLSVDGGGYAQGSLFPSHPKDWPEAEVVDGRVAVPDGDVVETVEHAAGYAAKAICHPAQRSPARPPPES